MDLIEYNQILDLNKKENTITVQSGATWEKVLNYLDTHNLSVSEMQSYFNFSVGGSLGVNCHGRGMKYGTISDSVQNITVITSEEIIFADRNKNYGE